MGLEAADFGVTAAFRRQQEAKVRFSRQRFSQTRSLSAQKTRTHSHLVKLPKPVQAPAINFSRYILV